MSFKHNNLYVIIDIDSQWFDALFEEDYNNIMNHVVDYVNYGNGASNDSGVDDDENI